MMGPYFGRLCGAGYLDEPFTQSIFIPNLPRVSYSKLLTLSLVLLTLTEIYPIRD